ncbi:hypothetical protein [Polyangium jinanense]|uniref:Tetratricopeptide repeat protein n=1 Tax=Polyangium jinanense TaxID=2829994 RepID=A0A9X3XBH3_9BACT|nr:hypothetical protein [Polyangium jinanense]MDC3956807.1 hypothetical protein [Polyangium jinanense]MDC3987197.1 hypothetical protein [Polyangium jinanense]
MKRAAGFFLAVALFGGARPGVAQQGDVAAAEHLFKEALALMEKGDYEHACPRLAESHKLDSGIGTLLYLGDCQEKLGKFATAWATFREAADAARRAGQPDREKIGRTRADALEAKLSRLVIEVPDSILRDGFVVRRDGLEVGSVLWNTGVPIDPGTYKIEATAPGKVPYSTSVVIERGSATTTVMLPPLEDAKVEPPPAKPLLEPVKLPPPPPPPPPRPKPKGIGPLGIVGIAAGGAGLLTMGASLGVGLAARARFDEAAPFCDATYCDREGVAIRKDAKDLAGVGTAIFVPGAVLTAAGAALFVVSLATRGPSDAAPKASVTLTLGPGGIFARGSF